MPQIKATITKPLFEQCARAEPVRTAVVHPVDAVSLAGAVEAARES